MHVFVLNITLHNYIVHKMTRTHKRESVVIKNQKFLTSSTKVEQRPSKGRDWRKAAEIYEDLWWSTKNSEDGWRSAKINEDRPLANGVCLVPCSGPIARGGQCCLRWSHTLQDVSGGTLHPQLQMGLVMEWVVREQSIGWSDDRGRVADKGSSQWSKSPTRDWGWQFV